MYGVYEYLCSFLFFKQKTAYEVRISDWSSDVCSSDLGVRDYYRNYSAWAPTHRLTTRRSLIRDHIVERLRTALSEESGAAIISRHGTTLFGLVKNGRASCRGRVCQYG